MPLSLFQWLSTLNQIPRNAKIRWGDRKTLLYTYLLAYREKQTEIVFDRKLSNRIDVKIWDGTNSVINVCKWIKFLRSLIPENWDHFERLGKLTYTSKI